ncbi:SppA protein, partial [Escherichia coli]
HPKGITEILYNLFCDKIHNGDIPTFGKPRVIDCTTYLQKEEKANAEESATGDGNSQQDVGKPDPRRSRSGKKSGTTPERDQEGIGAVSIQPPDEQQPNA